MARRSVDQQPRQVESDHEPIWMRLSELPGIRLVPDCANQLLAALSGEASDHLEV